MAEMVTADRVHLKATQNTKGAWTFEVSVETKNNEIAKQMLEQGFRDCKEVAEKLNLPVAGQVIETK